MKKKNHYDHTTKRMNYFTNYLGNNDILSNGIEKMNAAILDEFYIAVSILLSQKHYTEFVELVSNAISPATQNPCIPLREYRVKRNGHFKIVKIFQRFWGGCWITEQAF